jgi:hypothetical protein
MLNIPVIKIANELVIKNHTTTNPAGLGLDGTPKSTLGSILIIETSIARVMNHVVRIKRLNVIFL